MATLPLGPDSVRANALPFPAVPPMPAVARILSRYDRPSLSAFIAVAIDLLDTLDGDTDLEATGDEEDGSFTEDEPCARFALAGDGPGCVYSDDDSEHDGRENDDGE
jgi:hypothetical protein